MRTSFFVLICLWAVLMSSLISSCSMNSSTPINRDEDSTPQELLDIMCKYMDEVTDYQRNPDSTFFLTMLFMRDEKGPKLKITGCEDAIIPLLNEKYTYEDMLKGVGEPYKPVYGYSCFHRNRWLLVYIDNPQDKIIVDHYLSNMDFNHDEEYWKWEQPEWNIDTPVWFYRIDEDYHLSLDSIQVY